jgi:deoxyribose-phosphate aldolase
MNDVPARIEHTVLGPTTTWADVTAVLDAAMREGMRACIPPCYVADAADYAPGVDIATVVGFPHGQHATAVKCAEAQQAWDDGADELDVVANVGRLRGGADDAVEADLAEVVAAVPVPVKVIVEAPLLDDEQLRRACQAAVDADADFVKTATGFSDGGATVEDVDLMSEYLPVKASGGVGSWEQAKAMFDAGAERIGASSGDAIVAEYQTAEESGG